MKNWIPISLESHIDDIMVKSHEHPQIIFKDSVSCGISAYAKSRLQEGNDLLIGKADFNYLDLLRYRPISTYIANTLKVIHQSPQIIIVKNGEAVHMVSHHSILPDKIAEQLQSV